MDRTMLQSLATVGSRPWWESLGGDGLGTAATQQQCQSSCSSGNGGCAPPRLDKVRLGR
jgi:hypothetical protein